MKKISKFSRKKSKISKADLNFTIEDEVLSPNPSDANEILQSANKSSRLKRIRPTKKHYLISGIVILVVAILTVLIITTKHANKPITYKAKKVAVVVKPIIYYSPLTGVAVTKAQSLLPVTGVMIENSIDARPQSGISQAGVIFEALAEGGISRFLVLFQEGSPTSLGPIRSARPYYVDWALGFDATYVHVGGSPDGLSLIQAEHVKDINQFYHGGSFTRVTNRDAPHNVYTSMSTLNSLEATLGFNSSTFTSFPRKIDLPSKLPTASTINLSMSSVDFAVNYVYQKTTNSYLRSEGGAPMVDANTSAQLNPRVVIAMVIPWTNGDLDASGAYYTNYAYIGSGNCYIFEDGIATKGSWAKSTAAAQITFSDALGNPVNLNTGQTWITAVANDAAVSYL